MVLEVHTDPFYERCFSAGRYKLNKHPISASMTTPWTNECFCNATTNYFSFGKRLFNRYNECSAWNVLMSLGVKCACVSGILLLFSYNIIKHRYGITPPSHVRSWQIRQEKRLPGLTSCGRRNDRHGTGWAYSSSAWCEDSEYVHFDICMIFFLKTLIFLSSFSMWQLFVFSAVFGSK